MISAEILKACDIKCAIDGAVFVLDWSTQCQINAERQISSYTFDNL